eukprot:COSAG01_NODE_6801_length_3493_cov_4.260165_8_plen_158_part_00
MSYEELLFGGGTTDVAAEPPANPLALDFSQTSAPPSSQGPFDTFQTYGQDPDAKRQKTGSGEAGGQSSGASFHCNYCGKDLSHDGTFRIKCASCLDFDLCVHCFSVGVEIHPHKNDHPYRVMTGESLLACHLACLPASASQPARLPARLPACLLPLC